MAAGAGPGRVRDPAALRHRRSWGQLWGWGVGKLWGCGDNCGSGGTALWLGGTVVWLGWQLWGWGDSYVAEGSCGTRGGSGAEGALLGLGDHCGTGGTVKGLEGAVMRHRGQFRGWGAAGLVVGWRGGSRGSSGTGGGSSGSREPQTGADPAQSIPLLPTPGSSSGGCGTHIRHRVWGGCGLSAPSGPTRPPPQSSSSGAQPRLHLPVGPSWGRGAARGGSGAVVGGLPLDLLGVRQQHLHAVAHLLGVEEAVGVVEAQDICGGQGCQGRGGRPGGPHSALGGARHSQMPGVEQVREPSSGTMCAL